MVSAPLRRALVLCRCAAAQRLVAKGNEGWARSLAPLPQPRLASCLNLITLTNMPRLASSAPCHHTRRTALRFPTYAAARAATAGAYDKASVTPAAEGGGV